MEFHLLIHDSKTLNLLKTKPCLKIIHGLLASLLCLIKYPNTNSPDLQPNIRLVICKMPIVLGKPKLCINTLYNVCAVPWGCSVPWGVQYYGDIMSTMGGYLEYRGGIS